MTTPEPTPEAVEALASVVLPAMPNHCCGPDDMADCPWDAHDASGIARAVLAAGYVKPEWEPGRWYRAVAPDGTLWLETSNPDEVSDRARHGDRLERLYDSVQRHEWRAWDPEPRHLDQCCGGCETCSQVCPGCAPEPRS